MIPTPCTGGPPQPSDPCDVVVYSVTETDSLIANAQSAASLDCKQNIETTKSELSKDINDLPTNPAFDALKAQLKEEIKAEVLKELLDEIKAGKLKPVGKAVSQQHP